jgi:hypothetical protein
MAGPCNGILNERGFTRLFGRAVEFRTQDGQHFRSTLLSMEIPNPRPKAFTHAALGFPSDVPLGFTKAGTEVWLLDEEKPDLQ